MSRGRRPLRDFGETEKRDLLAILGDCRERLSRIRARLPMNGEIYYLSLEVSAAIDDLVQEITGDRGYFNDKPASAPPPRNR